MTASTPSLGQRTPSRSAFGTPAREYSPDQERPLRAYAVLASAYVGVLGGSLAVLRSCGRELPQGFGAQDVVMIGIATHKLSRLVAKDKVTSFLRAPFTQFQEPTGHGEIEEEPCGHGLRLALGELLVCPYCLAQWVATGLSCGLMAAPRLTRLLCTIAAAHTVSDFLQLAYRAAEEA